MAKKNIEDNTSSEIFVNNSRNNWIISVKWEIKQKLEKIDSFYLKVINLEKIDGFEWFIKHRLDLIDILNDYFSWELVWEDDDFIEFFNKSMYWKLDEEKYFPKQIKKFNDLLLRKNLLLKKLIKITLESGVYDEFLNQEEISDFINILDSEVFHLFDKIFFKLQENIKKYKQNYLDKNWNLIYSWKLVYGGIWKNWFLSYKDFLSKDDLEKFSNFDFWILKQKYLRDYLKKFQEIFLSWTTDYDKWLELAEDEMQTWKNINWNIWIVWSMEDYGFTWVLIDPELEIFIKKPSIEYAKKASDLSQKFFWESYRMNETKYANVEPIMSSWVVSFKRVLWKNFHNDKSIQNKYWMYWYSIESRLKWSDWVLNDAKKVLWELKELDYLNYWKKDIEHTWQHEFGHNLFKSKNTFKYSEQSLLEEIKANLFNILFKYEKINKQNLDKEEIILEIEYILAENIRRFKNLNDSSLIKYILSAKLQIQKLFENEIVYWWDDWLIKINPSKNNLKLFYWDMKDFLYLTKEIYEKGDLEKEKIIIKEIEDKFDENLERIIKFLKK